jgi:ribonuclease VapC
VIVDTSAIFAILNEEPEAAAFIQLIHDADLCRMSVVSTIELFIIVERNFGAERNRDADALIRGARIGIEPVTLDHGLLARQAFLDYGKGRHKAGLNFGDCFAYALAKATNEPLLFKGNDFSQTDITPT